MNISPKALHEFFRPINAQGVLEARWARHQKVTGLSFERPALEPVMARTARANSISRLDMTFMVTTPARRDFVGEFAILKIEIGPAGLTKSSVTFFGPHAFELEPRFTDAPLFCHALFGCTVHLSSKCVYHTNLLRRVKDTIQKKASCSDSSRVVLGPRSLIWSSLRIGGTKFVKAPSSTMN